MPETPCVSEGGGLPNCVRNLMRCLVALLRTHREVRAGEFEAQSINGRWLAHT